ncbi:MAG: restriction endonuclease subunit S [Deltaproteobacteria bacterium]|jgi:type I restriction enzyme S subunit|nr:restriction endonuclease subunit S [Deltaproteobacteria bacterium]
MNIWKTCVLGDVLTFQRGHDLPKNKMVHGEYPVVGSNGIIGNHNKYTTEAPAITIGRSGNTGNPFIVYGRSWSHNTTLYVKEFKGSDPVFVYYLLKTLDLGNFAGGSAVPTLNRNHIHTLELAIPPLDEQIEIGQTLRALDEKIANNTKINQDLEQIAQAIFKSWFVDFEPFDWKKPSNWITGSLLDIAEYLNGLAMQRFQPVDDEANLPVLKIKELRQGFCDSSSDLCSSNIRSDYIVHDGDVIFSWSGSLLVDIWCGGDCGLNQHLFKVTSKKYDKWFYYLWTYYYLSKFISLAADKATTMGHIKRDALKNAKVIIPTTDYYKKIGELLIPIFEQIVRNRIECRKLSLLRDQLLPRLMSGELSVADMDGDAK